MPLPRRPLLDPDHPMFARAWVRWLTCLAPIAWGGGEFVYGSPFWGMLFVGAGAYAGWVLLRGR
jgi:hypothetical protein